MAKQKFWAGQECPKTATYGQYHDTNGQYLGTKGDRYVKKGDTFPPSENNYHFEEK